MDSMLSEPNFESPEFMNLGLVTVIHFACIMSLNEKTLLSIPCNLK